MASDSRARLQITGIRSALEKRVLPKLRFLESTLQPINRLPKDIFVLIPRYFATGREDYDAFPTNTPLITMTHVCRSWRTVLLSTPALWTQINFSVCKSQQATAFIDRSGEQLIDVYQFIENADSAKPFLPVTLLNIHRLRRLEIISTHPYLERVLKLFTKSAPELEHLDIMNHLSSTDRDMEFHDTTFGGRLPKLLSLSLHCLRTNFRAFKFPSLTRLCFATETKTSVQDLTSFFERCPLLEFIQICLFYTPQPPTPPPRQRVRLPVLKELKLDGTASTCGLLDHLILPKCTEMTLRGRFTAEEFDIHADPPAQIHPSSIDHLPVTRGITNAEAMPNSCILSGPNGRLRFRCSRGDRDNFDANFFTFFSPTPAFEIRELSVGARVELGNGRKAWEQTVAQVRGAFGALVKLEDLTIVNCQTEPFFAALGATTDDLVLLPALRKLTIYVGYGDLDASTLVRSAEERFERSQPLGKVTIVFDNEPEADVIPAVESLRGFVGELNHSVGETPELRWDSESERHPWV